MPNQSEVWDLEGNLHRHHHFRADDISDSEDLEAFKEDIDDALDSLESWCTSAVCMLEEMCDQHEKEEAALNETWQNRLDEVSSEFEEECEELRNDLNEKETENIKLNQKIAELEFLLNEYEKENEILKSELGEIY